MPRSPRQMKVYHLQKCRSHILKALARLDKIGLCTEEQDATIKMSVEGLQIGLNTAFTAANNLLQVMTSRSIEIES